MNSPASQFESREEVQRIYSARFSGLEEYRLKVWQILVSQFFSQWIQPNHSVLDLGCGYGEFINTVRASRKFALDLNPTSRTRLASDIELVEQDSSLSWPLPQDSL